MAEMEYEFHHTVAPPTLGTILSIYPIRRGILDCLGTRNILAFMQTSRAIRQDLRENEWNINKKLERFFKNPIAFRTQLGQADALITGDFVLGFFERIVWPDVGLDLVIRHNDNLAGMQKFLVSENYTKAESVPINDTTCKNLTAVWNKLLPLMWSTAD